MEDNSDQQNVRFEFDVFISFRGEDTRNNLAKSLYEALVRNGVRTFLDDEELDRGEKIGDRLWKAIKQSEISIPLFSPRYSDSHWCLMELAAIIACQRLTVPVFYKVDRHVVATLSGDFGIPFPGFENRFGKDEVESWKAALEKASTTKPGFDITDYKNEEEIQGIVRFVMENLKNPPLALPKHLVGIESPVDDLLYLLDLEAAIKDVRIIMIRGKEGTGKTTLAKVLYNRIFLKFDSSCFIPNVAETSKLEDGLISLQRQLTTEILKLKDPDPVINYTSTKDGIKIIKKLIGNSNKKVLIILDDVDDEAQIEALAGAPDWFCGGSRIIITTRSDEHKPMGHVAGDDYGIVRMMYRPKELDFQQSLELFCYYAFGIIKLAEDHEHYELSMDVVGTIQGNPLVLEVLGSFLSDKLSLDEWEDMAAKLKRTYPAKFSLGSYR